MLLTDGLELALGSLLGVLEADGDGLIPCGWYHPVRLHARDARALLAHAEAGGVVLHLDGGEGLFVALLAPCERGGGPGVERGG